MNRKTRRDYLKTTSYFKTKKSMNLEQWRELVRSNIAAGRKYMDYNEKKIRDASEKFLSDKESKYRVLLNELKYDDKLVDLHIDLFFATYFKEYKKAKFIRKNINRYNKGEALLVESNIENELI